MASNFLFLALCLPADRGGGRLWWINAHDHRLAKFRRIQF
ncbi:hypothetical protein DSM3645_24675 [Blastopirellula marina DSM 3645]|uniref:Uncharacterized protein n=1 Tax=Blastopirellula marina DSM 3645 TaxID=314230 RepID=A3ZV26_9BACT|nr:hypothetical protein DSM3645_24675 [Blastopirellula marina DSM 3645]